MSKNTDRMANSVDPDQEQSDLGLHTVFLKTLDNYCSNENQREINMEKWKLLTQNIQIQSLIMHIHLFRCILDFDTLKILIHCRF